MTESAMTSLDRRRPEPLWHQAERAIRARIEAGEWPAGSQIPAEDRLCDLLGVSRITVRHALRNLEALGLLRREHGRGTFVRSATVVAGARGLTSFSDEMAALGLTVGSRMLEQQIVPANARVSAALEIEEGEPVALVRRLRLGNGSPIGVQTAHLRLDRVPGLLDEDLSGGSLYGQLERRYGIKPSEATEIYRVGAVGPEDAELLEIAVGSPAFIVERLAIDPRGPFEFTLSIMRGDRYEIRSTLRI
ncbi:GntR family transcriptional regulator [Kaistia sp. UC242_56]|uniref:GntR family transcriptional regulator n=1 Tax=Kaistia sp. UC242_56 TaxID=3374625 RepID=UPI0037B03974